jgi:hypothetical protein
MTTALRDNELKIDSRGRIRFGFESHRIEVTKTGVRAYERYRDKRGFIFPRTEQHEHAKYGIPSQFFTNTEFLTRLTKALNMVGFDG